jgi:hypothetical protein
LYSGTKNSLKRVFYFLKGGNSSQLVGAAHNDLTRRLNMSFLCAVEASGL